MNCRDINPGGKVPVPEVEGDVLTEGPAILQVLDDGSADLALAPVGDTLAQARVTEVQNFIGTELPNAFGPQVSTTA